MASSGDLTSIHDKFATVYTAGCLAIRENILPFERKEFLEAILTCEEDHVRFVADELAGLVKSQLSPIDIIRAYIQENRDKFIDLKDVPEKHNYECCLGHTNVHKDRAEYLFSENRLKEIMGCQGAVNELKKALYDKRLIATVSAGNGKLRYVVRRSIQGQRTGYLVAIFADVL